MSNIGSFVALQLCRNSRRVFLSNLRTLNRVNHLKVLRVWVTESMILHFNLNLGHVFPCKQRSNFNFKLVSYVLVDLSKWNLNNIFYFTKHFIEYTLTMSSKRGISTCTSECSHKLQVGYYRPLESLKLINTQALLHRKSSF